MISLYRHIPPYDNVRAMNILLADRFFSDSNYIEAGLWMVIGIGFLVRIAAKAAFR